MTWKQFWCRHFWKQIGELILLRKERLHNLETGETQKYNIYAVNYACIKCGSTKLSEEKMYTD